MLDKYIKKANWDYFLNYFTLLVSLCFHTLAYSQSITIVAVGDVLLHKPLQQYGLQHGFDSMWQAVTPIIQQADIAYANLEGPAAEGMKYTNFPMFNYPPEIIPALKRSGFDIISTANNHSLDRFSLGIDKTIDLLNQHRLHYTGTHKRDERKQWYRLTKTKGFQIAWLACTQDTNGIKDKYQQVLYCYKDKQTILNLIQQLSKQVDAVIITPHWGTQYHTKPSRRQKHFAQLWINQGALAVIGSHPHCLQPIQWIKTRNDGEGLVAYSMGNFVSNQGSLKNRSSGILWLKLSKEANKTQITSIKFIPTYMQNRGGKMQLEVLSNKHSRPYRYIQQIIKKSLLSPMAVLK